MSNEELKQIVLVVPTQRLALHILQRLALQRKAFVPPKILNFEKFVSEFSQKDQNKNLVVSDLSAELILGSLLKEKNYKHLMVRDEHELLQFFKEIIETGLLENAFERMRDCFAEDIYRSEEHLEFMNERVAELEDLFKSFQEILRSHSLLMKQSYDKAKCNELCQSIGPGSSFQVDGSILLALLP